MAGVEFRRSVCALPLLLLLLLCSRCSSQPCPALCSCESTVVTCAGQNLSSIPQPLPENTSSLVLSGNSIPTLGAGFFPKPLERLTRLDVSGSGVEQLDSVLFTLLPALRVLDLSNNWISVFNVETPPQSHRMELLNLSRSLLNHSYVQVFADLLAHLPRVSRLDLSSNDLLFLPEGIFSELSDLTVLDLRNNTLVWFGNDTQMNRALRELDLRDNALKVLPNLTLTLTSDLRLRLAGNPWRCDCALEEMLEWLERREVVVEDRENLTCSEPAGLRGVPLFQLERSRLPCWSGAAGPERVLEPSYVFLGMVLALIGVIFLLVLYLNRKGIKKWIYNIRDACRDHMEGYHYRYETSSSLNSHV